MHPGQQTSKEQTKMTRFIDLYMFVLCKYTMHELHNQNILVVSTSVSYKQHLCFVHRQSQKVKQKYLTKNFVGFQNNRPL